MAKVRKNDIVKVIAGKDRDKTGKVINVYPRRGRALVQGINYVKRHTRRTREDQQGGVIQKESPIHVSNLMVVCPKCGEPARIGFTILSDGSKTRMCKKCKEIV